MPHCNRAVSCISRGCTYQSRLMKYQVTSVGRVYKFAEEQYNYKKKQKRSGNITSGKQIRKGKFAF